MEGRGGVQDCLHSEVSWEKSGLESGELGSGEGAVGEDAAHERSGIVSWCMLRFFGWACLLEDGGSEEGSIAEDVVGGGIGWRHICGGLVDRERDMLRTYENVKI